MTDQKEKPQWNHDPKPTERLIGTADISVGGEGVGQVGPILPSQKNVWGVTFIVIWGCL